MQARAGTSALLSALIVVVVAVVLYRPESPPPPRLAAGPPPSRAPETPAAPPPASAAPERPRRGAFTAVEPGETLADVARRVYGPEGDAERLLAANRDELHAIDQPLRPGLKLRTP